MQTAKLNGTFRWEWWGAGENKISIKTRNGTLVPLQSSDGLEPQSFDTIFHSTRVSEIVRITMAVESFVFLGRKVILSRETYNYDEIQDPPGETRQN